MKAVFLCFSLCSLAWAQLELQPHYRKTKQKCVGEHQIMVKSRHSKHGFYIFNYMYSSTVPDNQTQIQKEENKTTLTATNGPDENHKPRKPSDNLTDANQETRGGQKHLAGKGDDRKPENRTTAGRKQNVKEQHGNIRDWDLQQHVELIRGKGEDDFARGDDNNEIDGSGDIDFPGQVGTHHGIAIGSEDSDQGKDYHITRDPESGIVEGKGKGGKPAKPSKNGTMKIWPKENEFSVIQETNAYSDIPKKIKEPENKDYSEVSLKGKIDSANKESGQEGNLSYKEPNVTARLHSRFSGQSNVSRDLLWEKVQVTNKSNVTSSLDTDKIKMAHEKGNRNSTARRKGEYEPTVIVTKWKDQFVISTPHPKSEARGDRSHHVDVAIKPHKKDNARGDVVTRMSSSKTEAPAISKVHKKDKSEAGVRGKFSSQVEDPIFTKPGKRKHTGATSIFETREKEKGERDSIEKVVSQVKDTALTKPSKTNQSGVILSGKLEGHLDGSPVTESYSEGEVIMSHKIISGSQVATSNTIERDRKNISEAGITHRTPKGGLRDVGLTKAHQKEVARHGKTNTQPHESPLGDPATHEKEKSRFGLTFQEVSEDAVKGRINYGEATAPITDLKKRNNVESSGRKAEQGRDTVQLNGALSFSPGSHDDMQHLLNLPKNGHVEGQEHSLPSVKIVKKVIKLSKGAAKVDAGRYGDEVAKEHQTYSGVSRRKNSQRAKKHRSFKKAHGSDSSPSSESKEERWKESRESYEDYQNDRVDSHPSAESAEDLSPESNQSDNHSNMED